MMDLRKRLFIIIGIIVGLVLALFFAILSGRKDNPDTAVIDDPIIDQTNVPEPAVREPIGFIAPAAPNPDAPPAEPDDVYIRQVATIFLERYNSYSNQNKNQHLEDAQDLASTKMSEWLRTQTVVQGEVYSGVMTDVIAANIVEKEGGKATVLLDIKEDRNGADGDSTVYRSGRIELLKIGTEWKVDGLYWEEL
jgi:hypothetical protein